MFEAYLECDVSQDPKVYDYDYGVGLLVQKTVRRKTLRARRVAANVRRLRVNVLVVFLMFKRRDDNVKYEGKTIQETVTCMLCFQSKHMQTN